jgi:hypothetical protein
MFAQVKTPGARPFATTDLGESIDVCAVVMKMTEEIDRRSPKILPIARSIAPNALLQCAGMANSMRS